METQVMILPINQDRNDYAKKVLELLEKYDIKALVDDRNEKIGKKIREAEAQKIQFMFVVGQQEEIKNEVMVRLCGWGDIGTFSVEGFARLLTSFTKI